MNLNPLRRWKHRRDTRNAFFACEDKMANLLDELDITVTDDPCERAKLLRQLADFQIDNARRFHAAFPRVRMLGEDRDIVGDLVSESKLYRALGDVEHVVACHGRVGRNWRFHEWGERADAILDEMCATEDLQARLALLDDLYDAVVPAVGGQAAEALVPLMGSVES